jgi:hypothetical protein
MKVRGKKRLMIEALITSLDNITGSCKKVGISRRTHYNWLKEDPAYAEEYSYIDDMQVDFYQQGLQKLAKDNNVSAIIFGLKTKGKHRGYVERQEVYNTVSGSLNVETFADAWEKAKKEMKKDEE